jgi:hypothetical protein
MMSTAKNSRAASTDSAAQYLLGALAMLRHIHEMTPDSGHPWTQAALSAVIEFVEKIDPVEGTSICGPLKLVLEALTELEFGRVTPLVTPAKSGAGRQRDRMARVAMKGMAAADISALMKLGLSREDAAKKVAAKLRENKVKIPGKRVLSWRTIAQWRDEIRSQRQENHAFRFYECVLNLNETMFLSEPFDQSSHSKSVKDLMSKLGEMIIKLRMVDS